MSQPLLLAWRVSATGRAALARRRCGACGWRIFTPALRAAAAGCLQWPASGCAKGVAQCAKWHWGMKSRELTGKTCADRTPLAQCRVPGCRPWAPQSGLPAAAPPAAGGNPARRHADLQVCSSTSAAKVECWRLRSAQLARPRVCQSSRAAIAAAFSVGNLARSFACLEKYPENCGCAAANFAS